MRSSVWGAAAVWAGRAGGIYLWRGRRFPINIGDHVCWYYPMLHPAGIIHQRRNGGWGAGDDEFALELDLRRAFAEVAAGLPQAVVHTAAFARSDITCLSGSKSDDLDYLLEFLTYAGAQGVTGVDYETQNLRPYNKDSELLTAAVSTEDETVSFALRHPGAGWSDRQLAVIDDAREDFFVCARKRCTSYRSMGGRVALRDRIRPVGAVGRRDRPCHRRRVGDVKPSALSLDWLCQQHFGLGIKKLSPKMDRRGCAMKGWRHFFLTMALMPNITAGLPCAEEHYQEGGLEGCIRKRYDEFRQWCTQLKGIPLDATVNAELRREYARKLAKAEEVVQAVPEAQEFRTLTHEPFNPGSPRHVITMLRDILKTRAGQTGPGWSTKDAVLKEVKHPTAGAVLNYRRYRNQGTMDPYSPEDERLPATSVHRYLFPETGQL
jgi:hypothetical protein